MMYYTISISAEFYVFLLILLLVFSHILCFCTYITTCSFSFCCLFLVTFFAFEVLYIHHMQSVKRIMLTVADEL